MAEIITGICLLVVFTCLLLLTGIVRQYRNAAGLILCDGVVSDSDSGERKIIVSYTAGGQSYRSPYDCKSYAAAGEMPPAGLKVQVAVSADDPGKPVFIQFGRAAGRGSAKGRYTDTSSRTHRRTCILGFMALAVMILYLFCKGFGLV